MFISSVFHLYTFVILLIIESVYYYYVKPKQRKGTLFAKTSLLLCV